MESTTKSLAVPNTSGITSQPSGQGAVLPSTQTELGCSSETVSALVALLLGLLKATHSPDAFAMAMMDAADMARDAGVTQEEWARVGRIIQKRYVAERRKNPISGMF